MAMKKILLAANAERPEALAAMRQMRQWLRGRAELVGEVADQQSDLSGFAADFVITFGGDGTILGVARRLGENQIPVLGVNLGRLGYLAALSQAEMTAGVGAMLEGNVEIEIGRAHV